jgi:carboxyl-terminal processing protease
VETPPGSTKNRIKAKPQTANGNNKAAKMFRKAIFFLCGALLAIGPVDSQPTSLKVDDIQRVMERLYSLHIENKELSPLIVRRAFKIYIEQFDPDKSYLLEKDVAPYLSMSDREVALVMERIERQDYSDFLRLNALMQDATLRAQSLRSLIAKQLISGNFEFDHPPSVSPAKYASTEEELIDRQAGRMLRFYQYHQSRTNLDSADRKSKVFALFEKKVQRSEGNYLFVTPSGEPMDDARIEDLLTVRILKSFAKSLDTHTTFFSPEEAYEMRMSLEKNFEGVGVILSEGVDGVMIAELVKGSPAEQSGKIHVNDYLVEIDGKQTQQVPFEEVLEMLKKKDQGEVVLGFKREDGAQEIFYRVALRKQPIDMKDDRINVSYEKVDGGIIGTITLHSFYESSDGISSERDIKEAIRQFRGKGELKGLVLDLRENSGGFLSQAVKVTGLFVSNGVVVISKYGKGEIHYLRNLSGKSYYNGPLVVLTSKMSASAAEIVAQALQDYGVGIVVGDERTFGKGSIQYQTITDGKADYFFKVTVGRYYTVSGKSTQIDGVIADIVVPTQYAPYKIGEKYLEYPLPVDQVEAAYNDPLTDLDERARYVFEKRYIPYLQRAVTFWKKHLPELRKNSAERLASNPKFVDYLKTQERIRSRLGSFPANSVDENFQVGREDLQMQEAVNIVKDMIQIEEEGRHSTAYLRTGTE